MRGIFVLTNENMVKGSMLQRKKAKVLLFHHGSQKLSVFRFVGSPTARFHPKTPWWQPTGGV